MKNFLYACISVLLCIAVMGAGFVLGRNVDDKPPTIEQEQPFDDDTTDKNTDGTVSEPEELTEWQLCTDVTQLAVGDKIIIVALHNDFALGVLQNASNRSAVEVVRAEQTVTCGADVQIVTLEAGILENTFAFNVGDGYLYASSSSSNQLKTRDDIQENASWGIEITSGGVASIVAQGTNTRNVLRYNVKSNLFSCYESNETQDPIAIYKQAESVEN